MTPCCLQKQKEKLQEHRDKVVNESEKKGMTIKWMKKKT